MPSLIYPRLKNDKVISIPSNDYSGETSEIIPYRINGEEYTVKILRAPLEKRNFRKEVNTPNNANPDILGYADLKSVLFFPDTLEVIPEKSIHQFHFQNGYFESKWDEGEYEIRMQVPGYSEDKIREIGHQYNFTPYETPLTNENVRRRNQAALNKKEADERERKEEALKELEAFVQGYQMNSENKSILAKISGRIFAWPELEREITVFRGQKNPMMQLIHTGPDRFFSTSLDWYISEQQFTSGNDNCCLFVIHAQPGVKYYSIVGDIDDAIKNYNAVRAGNENAETRMNEREGFEEEVLLEGNGVFYQDRAKTARGFRELTVEDLDRLKIDLGERPMTHTRNGRTVTQKTGVFEAYYFPPGTNTKKAPGSAFVFGGIPPKLGGKRRKTRKLKQKKRTTRKH